MSTNEDLNPEITGIIAKNRMMKSGGTNRPIESDVVNTQDTNVKDYSHKSTYGYIMRNGNRKARRHALSQIKKRK